jgi:DNA-binding transcriptional LysR family regulator
MNELDGMRTFVRIVERGGLTAVSRESGLGQSTISRRLKELEEALGVVLLERTTRQATLTEAGAAYYDRAKTILQLVDDAHEQVKALKTTAEGPIRISATSAFGVLHLCRLLFAFQEAHPKVRIDLGLTDRRIDLVREGVDLAVRLGPLNDSALIGRKLGDSRRILVAAPAYLDRRGTPMRPRDLADHNAILFAGLASGRTLQLSDAEGASETVTLAGDFQADQALAIRQALVAGRGLGVAHEWLVADLLATGELVRILPERRLDSLPLHVLMAPGRTRIARVRLLLDFLAAQIEGVPGFSPDPRRP